MEIQKKPKQPTIQPRRFFLYVSFQTEIGKTIASKKRFVWTWILYPGVIVLYLHTSVDTRPTYIQTMLLKLTSCCLCIMPLALINVNWHSLCTLWQHRRKHLTKLLFVSTSSCVNSIYQTYNSASR